MTVDTVSLEPLPPVPVDDLMVLLRIADRYAKATPPKHQVVFLGAGAFVDAGRARRDFEALKVFIESALNKRKAGVADVFWLGYAGISRLYRLAATLSSVEATAHYVGGAVQAFPDSAIHFVCHSLYGTIVAYWLATHAERQGADMVRSLVTINSPMVGSDRLLRACEEFIRHNKQLCGFDGPPTIAAELCTHSPVMQTLGSFRPRCRFVNVATLGDTIVPPETAVHPAGAPLLVGSVARQGGIRSHNAALSSDVVKDLITRIIEECSSSEQDAARC